MYENENTLRAKCLMMPLYIGCHIFTKVNPYIWYTMGNREKVQYTVFRYIEYTFEPETDESLVLSRISRESRVFQSLSLSLDLIRIRGLQSLSLSLDLVKAICPYLRTLLQKSY